MKRLRQAIEALGDGVGRGGDSDADGGGKVTQPDATASLPLERKRAIVLIMKDTFKSYHLAWARSSIESAFKVLKLVIAGTSIAEGSSFFFCMRFLLNFLKIVYKFRKRPVV